LSQENEKMIITMPYCFFMSLKEQFNNRKKISPWAIDYLIFK